LTLAELRSLSEKIDEDVARVLAYETAMKRRNTPGGTAPERVWEQIVALKDWLAHARS
jgi:argininosuccinate lyase